MKSYWIDSVKNFKIYDEIKADYTCDVCIIGGGLAGLTCGYYLSKAGLKIIIVEKDLIGQKTSGYSTAKITYQHNLIYNHLIKSYGNNFAKAYLNANKESIKNIKNIIDTENIDCDFKYQSNYVYTTNQDELVKIHAEVQALQDLGEEVNFVTNTDLPFKIVGAIENKNQARI